MAEPHDVLNALDAAAAQSALRRCCGATRWVNAMSSERPFASTPALFAAAEQHWQGLEAADYLEAFSHHPQIGEDLGALKQRFAHTLALSTEEQAGVMAADERTLVALRDANVAYRARFGFIFIVCASGKGAGELLAALTARLPNDPARELAIAAAEQAKITQLRLAGLAA
jgi:2-oxo-4-hydroxy-4-carboxy-5-ureidoimidazoline decarboxylase